MREALSDCVPFFFFFFFPSAPAFSCISRYSLGCGCLAPHRYTVSRRAEKLSCDSFLIPHPVVPLYLFSSHVSLPAWVREMCVSEAPKEGMRLCPEVTLGDGVDSCSGVS